jgi:hypothetical protein
MNLPVRSGMPAADLGPGGWHTPVAQPERRVVPRRRGNYPAARWRRASPPTPPARPSSSSPPRSGPSSRAPRPASPMTSSADPGSPAAILQPAEIRAFVAGAKAGLADDLLG